MKSALTYHEDDLRLSHELKQTLNNLMGWPGGLTHRQSVVWRKWLHEEWERPSRTDKYIMRLTYVVDNIFTKASDLPDEDNYRLKYVPNKPPARTVQQQSQVRSSPIPIDPTGETVIAPPNPSLPSDPAFSQEEQRAKDFMGDANPSTVVDVSSDDESWKRQRRTWLAYAGIKTDSQGNVIKKK